MNSGTINGDWRDDDEINSRQPFMTSDKSLHSKKATNTGYRSNDKIFMTTNSAYSVDS